MRLSGDEGRPSNSVVASEFTEMRQTSRDLLATRPEVYYGDGPFDPPSSDDEDDIIVRGGSLDDTESISLLSGGPLTPGRAERGEPSPRKVVEEQKVRQSFSTA